MPSLFNVLEIVFTLFGVGLLLNITANRFPDHAIRPVLKWGWFSVAIYVTIRMMTIEFIQQWLRGTFRPSVFSYVIAAILGAAMAVSYWAIINRIERSAESQQTAKAEPTPPLPSQKPLQNELRFVVPDALSTIRVTVNRRHFWTHLGALNDQLEGQGLLNFRFQEKELPLTIRTLGTDTRPYVDTKVYSASSDSPDIKPRLRAARKKLAAAQKQSEPQTVDVREVLFNKPHDLEGEVLKFERQLISETLAKVSGKVTHAAKLLGVGYQRLAYIIETKHPDLLKKRTPVRRRPRKE